MNISKEQFFLAASQLGIADEKAHSLWQTLESKSAQDSSISKLLYYFGAMIVISAMTWFMGMGWAVFGGGGIFIIAAIYAIAFVAVGAKLWNREDLKIPAGLLITMAVCMTPLAIYGLETYLGIFTDDSIGSYHSFYELIRSNWIWMEIGTIVAGIVALSYFPFPFITAPIFFSAWFMSMDVVPLLLGTDGSFEERQWISLVFGAVLLLISYIIDLKHKTDYAFWGYLFGTITFWGSLTAICFDKGEGVLFLYLIINIAMMVKSVLLKRKVLMVFGAIGAFSYVSHLAYTVFENSILFPFVLTFLGLALIYLGVLYQKNRERIESAILGLIPQSLRRFLP